MMFLEWFPFRNESCKRGSVACGQEFGCSSNTSTKPRLTCRATKCPSAFGRNESPFSPLGEKVAEGRMRGEPE